MERWLWQTPVAGKCTDIAWGQVCPQLHPVGRHASNSSTSNPKTRSNANPVFSRHI